MRVGGRIGRLDKTRLPTPTPPSPPPQEWEDPNDTEEEDPEELVPDSSDEELEEHEVQRKCHCMFRKTKPQLKVNTEDKPNNNKTRMKIAGTRASTVGSTTHRRFLGCCGKR
ncbi:hypothetical protein U9M48_030831 [Paspalum notatum var. saurae]|uniref:Uncharacterized protein n=1 Tax=Paspalum notatum var. saurae TaxID=547442 RepID=A0AAQ3X3Q3_PASNO